MNREVYRTPEERFESLPGYGFEPRYLVEDGLRMHYVDEGSGEPILMLHGEPTWAYLYRKVIPPLASDHRVIAPDYFGFGRSDKPTDRAFYTYDRHCRSVWGLVESLDLSEITVVVQDWGGPIGLRLATEHADRFSRLVILNTGIYRPGPGWPSPAWLALRELVERAGLDLVAGTFVQGGTVSNLPDEIVAAYDAPFPVPEARTGPAMFPLLIPLTENDPGASEMARVREALGRWEKPALVMFSDSDPIFTPRAGERMASRIPGASPFELVEGAGHFLQEEKGEEIAERISAWLDGNRS